MEKYVKYGKMYGCPASVQMESTIFTPKPNFPIFINDIIIHSVSQPGKLEIIFSGQLVGMVGKILESESKDLSLNSPSDTV